MILTYLGNSDGYLAYARGSYDETIWRNMYVSPDGIMRPMPFDTKRNGLWFFDGQFFYLYK
jgi:hypothetical protein